MQRAIHPNPFQRPTSLTEVFGFFCGVALCLAGSLAGSVSAASLTSNFLTQPISLADAINVTLSQNPNIHRSQKDPSWTGIG